MLKGLMNIVKHIPSNVRPKEKFITRLELVS